MRARQIDRDLRDEIDSHLEEATDEYMRGGQSRSEARRAALRDLGGVTQAEEAHRDVRSIRWLEDLRRDLGYALRGMFRTPGLTSVVALTLAVGIGTTAAITSLVDAVLLKSLPVSEPHRLVVVDRINLRGETFNFSYPLFTRLQDMTGPFSGAFAALDGMHRVDLIEPGAAGRTTHVSLHLVSGEYFEVLGVSAFIGRTLTADDNRHAGVPPVGLLSYRFWKRHFGSDVSVVGRTINVRGLRSQAQPLTIVGVAPAGFFGEVIGRAPDLWLPLAMQPTIDGGHSLLENANVGWLTVMGRLRDGISTEQADAALAPLGRFRTSDGRQGFSRFRDQFSLPLWILAGLVAVLLVMSCANVSSLLLARGMVRHREVALRLAMGASRGRLIRQFLAESTLLVAAGAVAGLVVAWSGVNGLLWLASNDSAPAPVDVTPDLRTFAFAALLLFGIVLVVGLAPAVSATRLAAGDALKGVASATRARLSSSLVVMQIALSVLLLMGSALLVQTLTNLRHRDRGFDANGLLAIRIEQAGTSDPGRTSTIIEQLIPRLSGGPDLESVSVSTTTFGSGISRTCCVAVDGYAHDVGEDRELRIIGISPGYFRTMRLRLLRGREFAAADMTDDPNTVRSAIVSEAFARRYFGHVDAVGRRFGWGDPPNVRYGIEIIGVAADALYDNLREEVKPLIYYPHRGDLLVVRTADDTSTAVAAVRREAAALNGNLQLDVVSVSDDIERTLVREKLLSRLSVILGVLAAALASLGLYGLMARTVAGRTCEIGIRMALGESRASVVWSEVRSALLLLVIGALIGLPAAVAGARLLTNQLFGVAATDPAVLIVTVSLLAVISAIAAFSPARRAVAVDPVQALRHD